MENVRVVVVDDSPLSVSVISGILEDNGFQVVGSAGCLEEVKEVIAETRPNLVTMDMTMPGTDGLECTRAVHEIDRDIRVIVISSMMDEEIVSQAKRNRVSGYLQKPVDDEDLIAVVKRVMQAEELFGVLNSEFFDVFKDALRDGQNKLTKTLITYEEEYLCESEYTADGIAVMIGIIGEFPGKMLISLSNATAHVLTATVLRREPKNSEEIIETMAEFANIVAGNACSSLNKRNRAYGLRVAPPSVLSGENMKITPLNYPTYTAIGESVFGKILLNIGFKRGELDAWT
ncbi:MAG: response regulator [Defluviitaleaceae bacterium]|nr:response regulator [Defluviitaleaceae bacterium]MCL2262780.1 response regulator [Defluviitaleaceae bacterium]